MLQAFGGLLAINGDPSGPPSRIGPSVVDLGTGMWTVIGILAALIERGRTGKGADVRTSLLETAVSWAARHAADYGATGTIPPRVGTGHNSLTPYGAFEAADGPFIIAAGNDRLFAKLANVIGRPEWITDERFATNKARTENRDVLVPMLTEIIGRHSADYWDEKLQEVGVPCAPIHSVPEVMTHPQVKAMEMFLPHESENLQLARLPLSIDGARAGFGTIAPSLDQDRDEVVSKHALTPTGHR